VVLHFLTPGQGFKTARADKALKISGDSIIRCGSILKYAPYDKSVGLYVWISCHMNYVKSGAVTAFFERMRPDHVNVTSDNASTSVWKIPFKVNGRETAARSEVVVDVAISGSVTHP
jgi:hypothetical protein